MKSCIVALSGGQDSTTCLFWAKKFLKPDEIHTLSFDYGQRHSIELESARIISEKAGVNSHEVITTGSILKSTSPLVDLTKEVGTYESSDDLPSGVEPTFVPGRNILFLILAANRAVCYDSLDIVIGVCQEDFAGYHDCRRRFISQMQLALNEGLYGVEIKLRIHTPLMYLTKAESVKMAQDLPGCMDALKYSHTCYNGLYPPCGKCHACLLRSRGFLEAKVIDPIFEREEKIV